MKTVFAKLFADVNEDFDILTQHALEVVFHAFLITGCSKKKGDLF